MRRTKAGWVLGAVLGGAIALVAGRAAATENKGDIGGKGGLGPQGPTGGDTGGTSPELVLPNQREVDRTSEKSEQEKPWELGATFETHYLLDQNDPTSPTAAANPVFNALGVYAFYRITDNDTIGVREFFTEDFIADPGETGVRADDVAVTYQRSVALPRNFLFSATASLSAPTSFESQKMGLITAPRLQLALHKRIGRYVDISAHAGGGAFIVRYAEPDGGATANPLANLTAGLAAEVLMPFHEALSFGFSINSSWIWYYNVQSGDPTTVANGVVADGYYTNQPVQQTYGGDIFARYTLPTLAGLKSDITVALASGDPLLGQNSYLHDGVGYTYLYFHNTGEAYAALTLRY